MCPARSSEGLGPFLRKVEERLQALSHEQLKDILRAHARGLPRGERAAFLDLLRPVSEGKSARASRADSVRLLQDVDSFVGRLEEGEYSGEWGWDGEIREERLFGDESWAEEMDDFFAEADEAFLRGDYPLAAAVYGRLLGTLRLAAQGEPLFPGREPPEQMVATDLGEAKARYFRALYLATPCPDRVERLLEAMEALAYVGPREVGIRAMQDADRGDLPDLDAFLGDWIEALGRVPPSHAGWGRLAAWLLREAVELRGGEEGLAALVRERGDVDPHLYLEWVERLVHSGRMGEALAAAREGVARVVDRGSRARLADVWAALAARRGENRMEPCEAAWCSYPSWRRLRALCAAAGDRCTRDLVMGRALQALGKPGGGDQALRAGVHLLRGDLQGALAEMRSAEKVAREWPPSQSTWSVVMPVVLVAGAGLSEPAAGSALERLWAVMDRLTRDNWGDQGYELRAEEPEEVLAGEQAGVLPDGELEPGEQVSPEQEGGRAGSDLAPPLPQLLREVLAEPFDPKVRASLLEDAHGRIERCLEHVLRLQQRAYYGWVARLGVAAAEACVLAGDPEKALAWLVRLEVTYRRFRAFRAELREEIAHSAVLGRMLPAG